MLSNIVAFRLTNKKARDNMWDRPELIIDYTGKLEGCNQSNTYNYSIDNSESFPIFRIKPGQYQCFIGNIFIGSDSDIVGISGFPDEYSNFTYSDLIQNPLVSMGKTAYEYSLHNQPFPITRTECKDKTKACSIRVAFVPTSSYAKIDDPDEGKIEASFKVIVDTRSHGDYTLKTYESKKADVTKRLSTYGLFISKSDRTFRYWKMDGMSIDESPYEFLKKYINKTMSSLTWYSISASLDEADPDTIYEFRFKYDEIPNTETLAPYLFRDDLSLTLPTKYGLYTIENASQPNPLDPDPTPTPTPEPVPAPTSEPTHKPEVTTPTQTPTQDSSDQKQKKTKIIIIILSVALGIFVITSVILCFCVSIITKAHKVASGSLIEDLVKAI